MTTTPSRGLSVVVAYKLGKAAIELLAVVAVLVLRAVLGRDAGALSARIERHWLHGIGACSRTWSVSWQAPATRA